MDFVYQKVAWLCSYFLVAMGDHRFLWLKSGEKSNPKNSNCGSVRFFGNFNMMKLKC